MTEHMHGSSSKFPYLGLRAATSRWLGRLGWRCQGRLGWLCQGKVGWLATRRPFHCQLTWPRTRWRFHWWHVTALGQTHILPKMGAIKKHTKVWTLSEPQKYPPTSEVCRWLFRWIGSLWPSYISLFWIQFNNLRAPDTADTELQGLLIQLWFYSNRKFNIFSPNFECANTDFDYCPLPIYGIYTCYINFITHQRVVHITRFCSQDKELFAEFRLSLKLLQILPLFWP